MSEQTVLHGVSLSWSSTTHVGLTRAVNEDAVVAAPPLFLVADGMGGHDAGDVASRMVAASAGELAAGEHPAVADIDQWVHAINTAVFEAGAAAGLSAGMGSTAVGLVLVDNGPAPAWAVVNVGDSRAYVFADGALARLSTDHSYVQELVDAGVITPELARTHPERNVVTRALGVSATVEPDYALREPHAGERYLLCSDGLTSEVEDDTITAVLATAGTAADAVGELLQLALERGGHDNISIVVVDVVAVADGADGAEITAPRDAIDVLRAEVPADVPVDDSPDGGVEDADVEDADDGDLISAVPTLADIRQAEAMDDTDA